MKQNIETAALTLRPKHPRRMQRRESTQSVDKIRVFRSVTYSAGRAALRPDRSAARASSQKTVTILQSGAVGAFAYFRRVC